MIAFLQLHDQQGGLVLVQISDLVVEPLHHVSPGDACQTQVTTATGRSVRVRESTEDILEQITGLESVR
jgi:hypothetical protein